MVDEVRREATVLNINIYYKIRAQHRLTNERYLLMISGIKPIPITYNIPRLSKSTSSIPEYLIDRLREVSCRQIDILDLLKSFLRFINAVRKFPRLGLGS